MTRNKFYWIIQTTSWAIYLIYIGLRIRHLEISPSNILIAGLCNFVLFISFTHLYRITLHRFKIESLRWYQFLIYPIIGNFILVFLLQILNGEILHFEKIFSPNYKDNSINYFIHILDSFRFTMPWFIFYHGIRYAELAFQNERDKLEAQMQLKIAELENLKNQLNPHFLFNALNSIRSLTLTDPKMARDATTKLSDLLRISLTYKDLKDIPFEEELNLVKDYLSLEKIRFEDRLNYSFEISKGILKALVPPMSLQLLAENAVKHGIGKEKMGGEVIVYAYKQEGNLVFGIKNTGSLIKLISDKNKRQGIGLENLKRRLELNYGIKDGFQISEINKVVTSQVSIPMRVK